MKYLYYTKKLFRHLLFFVAGMENESFDKKIQLITWHLNGIFRLTKERQMQLFRVNAVPTQSQILWSSYIFFKSQLHNFLRV